MDKVVADTSVIINGQLVAQVESGSFESAEIIIPQAVFDELQSQASSGRDQGFAGLDRISRLREIADRHGLTISQSGEHVPASEIELAGLGRIDSMITDVAREKEATLYTSDRVQYLAAKSQGVMAVLLREDASAASAARQNLEFLKFFDDDTMSVHLKERQPPLAKRGRPGGHTLVKIPAEPLERRDLERMTSQIMDAVNATETSTTEISKDGATVVQHGDYRIAITRPPFSDSIEITIVHPIVRMSIQDYDVPEPLMKRFEKKAEGIVISGPPGSGKSTLASSLGNFYHAQDKIVKTFESPRDLQVEPGVTQYSKLEDSFDNSADILLLVRPDYTIFDEVRRREDFETFADLRMTGVGMVGVVHANTPIDAIQRFIGKIELGMIPNVLDTVIFVKDGRVDAVYDLELAVKVPSGMTESDLARPVIVVRDFVGGKPAYEIYTFGEENVIMPISEEAQGQRSGVYELAAEHILDVVKKYDRRASVEIISESRAKIIVSKKHKAKIIGKGGERIEQLQKQLGMSLDVRTHEEVQEQEPQTAGSGGDQAHRSRRSSGVQAHTAEHGAPRAADDHGSRMYEDYDATTTTTTVAEAAGGGRDNRARGRRRDGGGSYGRRKRHAYDDYMDGHDDDMFGDASRFYEGGSSHDGDHAGTKGDSAKPGDELPFSISNNRNLIYIDVGKRHQSKNVEIVGPDDEQVATGWVNKKGLVKIPTRTSGGRAILDMDSPASDVRVRLAD